MSIYVYVPPTSALPQIYQPRQGSAMIIREKCETARLYSVQRKPSSLYEDLLRPRLPLLSLAASSSFLCLSAASFGVGICMSWSYAMAPTANVLAPQSAGLWLRSDAERKARTARTELMA